MKFAGLVFFLSVAVFWQCAKEVSNENVDRKSENSAAEATIEAQSTPPWKNISNMKEIFSSSGSKDGLEYRIVGRFQPKGQYEGVSYPNDNLVIEYELKNTGAKNYILYNQGHSGHNDSVVYAEPLSDGAVEVSQKAFQQPKDKNCPATFVAITPRGAWLKAGQTVRDKIYLEFPLKRNFPYSICEPQAELPAYPAKVRFCLGFQEAGTEVKIDEQGNVSPLPEFKNQSLLCTEAGEIK